MANLPAVAADGATIVYLQSFGAGTDQNPYIPANALTDNAGNSVSTLLAGSTRALTVAVVDSSGNHVLNFATSTKQDTLIGHVDNIEGSLSTLLGYVDGIETALAGTLTVNTGLTQPLTNAQLRAQAVPVVDGFSIPAYDYISLGYTGSNLTTVAYKTGGSGGTTVATLTLAYDGNGNITSVTKS